MQTLTVSVETYLKMVQGLVVAGVTYEAVETKEGLIKMTFTGGV